MHCGKGIIAIFWGFLVVLVVSFLRGGEGGGGGGARHWALGYHYMGFRHFLYVFWFPKLLSFFSCVGTKAPAAGNMPWGYLFDKNS